MTCAGTLGAASTCAGAGQGTRHDVGPATGRPLTYMSSSLTAAAEPQVTGYRQTIGRVPTYQQICTTTRSGEQAPERHHPNDTHHADRRQATTAPLLGWRGDQQRNWRASRNACPTQVPLHTPLPCSTSQASRTSLAGMANSSASDGVPLATCCSSSQRLIQRSTSSHLPTSTGAEQLTVANSAVQSRHPAAAVSG